MRKIWRGTINKQGSGFEVHYKVRPMGRFNRKWFPIKLEATAFLHNRPAPTAYDKIQFAMREHEKSALKIIRKWNRFGEGYRSSWQEDYTSYNALRRLEAKGFIRFHKSRTLKLRGYWEVR
jgi:hypothetical protein